MRGHDKPTTPDGTPPPEPARSPSWRRWAWAAAGLAGLVLVGVLVERLTRPADTPLALDENVPALQPPLSPPPAVEPTVNELVAEGKQLAEEIRAEFPDDGDALGISGRLFYMVGSAGDAVSTWNRALELNPRCAEAWLGIAEHAHEQGDFDRAIEAMHRLAEAAPAMAREKIFLLADSCMRSGRASETIAALQAAGAGEPLPSWAHTLLGQAYSQLKDYPRAAEEFRQAVASNPDASPAHYGLSVALARMGKQEESAKAREAYVRAQEKNLVIFDRMQGIGSSGERADPKKLSPLVAFFHLETGRMYAAAGRRDRARTHWLRAWALAPDRPEPRQYLSLLDQPPFEP